MVVSCYLIETQGISYRDYSAGHVQLLQGVHRNERGRMLRLQDVQLVGNVLTELLPRPAVLAKAEEVVERQRIRYVRERTGSEALPSRVPEEFVHGFAELVRQRVS